MRYSKKLDKFLDQEIKSLLPGYDEEKAFEKLGITKKTKKPSPIFSWSLKIAYSLVLIVVTVLLTITLYNKVEKAEYSNAPNIISIANNKFKEELATIGDSSQILFVSPYSDIVIGIYELKKDKTYRILCYCDDLKFDGDILINDTNIDVERGLLIEEITLEETNELILIIEGHEVFSTNF